MERALMEFLLYEGLRLNLVVAAWRDDAQFSGVGGRFELLDQIADEELQKLLELAKELGPEDRPLSTLVAMGMVRLHNHVQELAAQLKGITDGIVLGARVREIFQAKLEAYFRDMDATAIVSYMLCWKLHQSLKVCVKTLAAPVV